MAVAVGFTVTVTSRRGPAHPLTDGIILYTTVPGMVPVAVRVCAIVLPLDAVAPVTPVTDPKTQLNVVPVTGLLNTIDVVLPVHIVCEGGVAVMIGVGFTVMVNVFAAPEHVGLPEPPPAFVNRGVTVMVVEIGALVEFVAVKEGTVLVPDVAAKPTAGLLLVHAYETPVAVTLPAKTIGETVAPLHTVTSLTVFTVGIGLIVTGII